MAKKKKKNTKVTTEQALESLLGKKAAKRIRRLAVKYAKDKRKGNGRRQKGG